MEDAVHFFIEEKRGGNIVLDEPEIRSPQQMLNVVFLPRDEIIHGQNAMAIPQIPVAQMGADKPCAAGD